MGQLTLSSRRVEEQEPGEERLVRENVQGIFRLCCLVWWWGVCGRRDIGDG